VRIGPLFIVAALYIWGFLAAVAWALTAVVSRREPRLSVFGLSLLAGGAGVLVALFAGGRGVLSLLLSFPLCFAAAVLVSVLAGRLHRSP
jgi:hypothetical protein